MAVRLISNERDPPRDVGGKAFECRPFWPIAHDREGVRDRSWRDGAHRNINGLPVHKTDRT